MTAGQLQTPPPGAPPASVRIGAHMSVAGGVANAVARAVLHECEALQIFAKNANRWRGAPLDADDIRRFRNGVETAGLTPVVSHASYLINLASAHPLLREQSIAALVDELERAELLGLSGVVLHPGTCTSGTEDDASRLVAEAINIAFGRVPGGRTALILEHTAGQGRTIGHRFEHLRAILDAVDGSPRVRVCLDTCHLVAAGYDIASDQGFRTTFDAFDRLVGFDRLHVLHANDSKRPCGSRIDRHAHIGDGCLGLDTFRRFFGDPRFTGRAFLIETEKSPAAGRPGTIVRDPLDMRNLAVLKGLRPTAASAAIRC